VQNLKLKKELQKDSGFVKGHRTCSGCGIPQIVRTILRASDKPVVVINATGCLEVTSTIYPYTSWNVPYLHSLFANAASTASGVEAAFKALMKQKKIKDDVNIVVFGGDGGSYDIGLQALSGAMERRHNMLFVCYDNAAYMNTGIQRSSATPYGAWTTTSEVGKVQKGKELFKKDLTKIMVAHELSYIAQAAVHDYSDLFAKAKKAFSLDGPKFMNVLQPCVVGWKFYSFDAINISKLAVETRFWPLYEVVEGEYKLNYKPSKIVPIKEFLMLQKRFKHVLKDETLMKNIQDRVEFKWKEILKLCGEN